MNLQQKVKKICLKDEDAQIIRCSYHEGSLKAIFISYRCPLSMKGKGKINKKE